MPFRWSDLASQMMSRTSPSLAGCSTCERYGRLDRVRALKAGSNRPRSKRRTRTSSTGGCCCCGVRVRARCLTRAVGVVLQRCGHVLCGGGRQDVQGHARVPALLPRQAQGGCLLSAAVAVAVLWLALLAYPGRTRSCLSLQGAHTAFQEVESFLKRKCVLRCVACAGLAIIAHGDSCGVAADSSSLRTLCKSPRRISSWCALPSLRCCGMSAELCCALCVCAGAGEPPVGPAAEVHEDPVPQRAGLSLF